MAERRLGRGLESLLGQIGEAPPRVASEAHEIQRVAVGRIQVNPKQPRRAFAERELSELADSVKAVGILQPLVVRRAGEGYELIAGERRLRAAKIAGLDSVPIVERAAGDDELLTLALIENLHREDLNPIEKAKGFRELIERHGLTQEEAAKRIGKDRTTIANFIRLLELPEAVQHVVSRGTISMGHARALLGIPQPSTQQAVALRIEEEGLSVREVERIAALHRSGGLKPKRKPASTTADPHIRDLEDRARQRLGTKVVIEHKDGQGRMIIHFFSDDDLERVLGILGISG